MWRTTLTLDMASSEIEGKCTVKSVFTVREKKAGGGKREEENKTHTKPVFFPNP